MRDMLGRKLLPKYLNSVLAMRKWILHHCKQGNSLFQLRCWQLLSKHHRCLLALPEWFVQHAPSQCVRNLRGGNLRPQHHNSLPTLPKRNIQLRCIHILLELHSWQLLPKRHHHLLLALLQRLLQRRKGQHLRDLPCWNLHPERNNSVPAMQNWFLQLGCCKHVHHLRCGKLLL